MQMRIAENLATALADASRADVKSRVAAIALRGEDRLLEEGHAEKYCPLQPRLHGQPLGVRHRFPMLEMAPQDSQVHRPAVVRDAIVLARRRPAAMVEANLRSVTRGRELEPNHRPRPLGVSARQAQLERCARIGPRYLRLPQIARSEVELVRGAECRVTLRVKGPPCIETRRSADGIEDSARRRGDGEVLQDVWHCGSGERSIERSLPLALDLANAVVGHAINGQPDPRCALLAHAP